MAGIEAGSNNATHIAAGPFSSLARRQYATLAAMRWQMFKNSLRTSQGAFELGARTFTYLVYGSIGFGISVGLGVGSYAMIHTHEEKFLPLLFWAVFLLWQALPILLASFQEQFDLGILLRFPLSFGAYSLLYVIFGLIDVSSITGGLCSLGLLIGITVARPGLFVPAALALLVFAAFNILMARAVFAWIDRWLAQRRTREIVGAIFVVCMLSLQLLNPALHEGRRNGRNRAERIAQQREFAEQMYPWLSRANAVQRWLPPGLAAQSVGLAGQSEIELSLDSIGLLGAYALLAGSILGLRLRSEYAGENLGQAPGRQKIQRRETEWLATGSGPVAAVIEKELRAMLRTLPLLYAVGAPLVLLLVFSGAFLRSGPLGHTFALALPVCLLYSQLGFTQIFYNNLGAEGPGIQLYFLAPTPIRTVMLAKNLFHSFLFLLVATVAGILASLRLGIPDGAVLAASAAWLLFSLPSNLIAGNIFSLTMAYRINPGRLTRQRGSQANALASMLIQLAIIAVGAAVFATCWIFDVQWLATVIFLALGAIAAFIWHRNLRNADDLANRHKDALIGTLAKTG